MKISVLGKTELVVADRNDLIWRDEEGRLID